MVEEKKELYAFEGQVRGAALNLNDAKEAIHSLKNLTRFEDIYGWLLYAVENS